MTPEEMNLNQDIPDSQQEEFSGAAEQEEKAPVNGRAEITCDPEGMLANLVLHAPRNGGKAVTVLDVLKLLKMHGVTTGIDDFEIKDMIKNEFYETPICVARAIYPKRGMNGSVNFRFQKDRKPEPKRDEYGVINYRELDLIVPIRKGEVIADITLPTEGKPGSTIFGKQLAAEPGKPATVTLGKNTVLTADGSKIVAMCDGHVVYGTGCFNVEDTVTIKSDLDVSVGNISFFGDVHIKGNVMEGFSINAGKSVKIDGSVTGGEITAGGSITIVGGCINSKIRCEGNVSIGFCENADIVAKGDVESKQFVCCEIFCYGALTAKGTNGVIVGGKITAMRDINAGIIGSEKYTQTEINIGDGSVIFARKRNAEADLRHASDEYDNAVKNIEFLTHRRSIQGGLLTVAQQKQMKTETQNKLFNSMRKKELSELIAQLQYDIENKDSLSAFCTGIIYPGVHFCINFLALEVTEIYKHARVTIFDNQIVIMTM